MGNKNDSGGGRTGQLENKKKYFQSSRCGLFINYSFAPMWETAKKSKREIYKWKKKKS